MKVIQDFERQESLIKACHEGIAGGSIQCKAAGGHWGRDKMLAILNQRYIFPHMKKRVQYHIKYCDMCQRINQHKLSKSGSTLHPIKVPNRLWSQIGIDLIGPLPEVEGMRYIITAIDYTSKWVEAKAIPTKTSENVAEFLHSLQTRYGVSCIHITDQGREFNNSVIRDLYEKTGVQHKVSSAYHPQTNGLVERQNRTTEEVIQKVMKDKSDWLHILQDVLFACRIAKHASTGFSPYRLMFNQDPILPYEYNDNLLDCPSVPESVPPAQNSINSSPQQMNFEEQHMASTTQKSSIIESALTNIHKAQKHQTKNYNARNSSKTFKIGDKVLKRNMRDLSRKEKLVHRWTGPYSIIGISQHGGYYLRDKFAHNLKNPIPPQQVTHYFSSTIDKNPKIQGKLYLH